MGPKHSSEKIKRHDTTRINNNNNIFFDAVDLEVEAEEIKLGNRKSMYCPNCRCTFNTSNTKEIEAWVAHKKNCKKGKINQNNNNNLINNNINPKPNIAPPPPPRVPRPPPLNINTNNYNTNIPYRPQTARNANRSQITNTNQNVIRVNPNNQELNNILEAIGLETKKVLPRGNRNGTFEEKVDYLRYDISKKKVDFTEGCETLFISRENVLENSLIQIEIFNIYKEIKIIFTGEESSDAGGLIREWLTILFQQIMDEKTGLFERSDTDEISYLIKKNIKKDKETLNKYYFIGKILAKALLENLTVNCCLNKVIYQLILNEKIKFEDLIFIDKPLYNSLKNLKNMKTENSGEDNIAMCEIYFSYQYRDDKGNLMTENLIPNGDDILVTSKNLDLYIEKRIESFKNSQLIGVKEIIRGINDVFSVDYLKIFTSDQLALLINGTPFIDVDDWRINTQYKDYNDYDDTIINFWTVISSLSQEQLSNFLLFCTGSSRVPIGGFKSLESNRGQISKFEIVKIEYKSGAKNFLRVHTCFNRLDLPNFPDEYSLRNAINFALENQILGYGIE